MLRSMLIRAGVIAAAAELALGAMVAVACLVCRPFAIADVGIEISFGAPVALYVFLFAISLVVLAVPPRFRLYAAVAAILLLVLQTAWLACGVR